MRGQEAALRGFVGGLILAVPGPWNPNSEKRPESEAVRRLRNDLAARTAGIAEAHHRLQAALAEARA